MPPATSQARNRKTKRQPLLLASSSRYRRELLERLGLAFDTASPDVDETRLADERAPSLVARLAESKARALAATYPEHLIIGSDQVASLEEEILGKPGNVERANEQLGRLSGRTVHFYTGLVLFNPLTKRLHASTDVTEVRFRDLTAHEIANYVSREQPLDCAGSFKSEGLGVALFEHIRTDDPAALIGLPLVQLCAMLRREGCDPLA